LRIASGSVTPDGDGFIVKNGTVDLGGGRKSENTFRVKSAGAQTDGANVYVPVAALVEVEYGWVPVGVPSGSLPKL
jgi:hypothetical protein